MQHTVKYEIKCVVFSSYLKGLVKKNIKFIVFGYHKVMLDAISECLRNLNAKYIRIDGSTKNELRNTYIGQFQKDKSCQVAVLSLKGTHYLCTCTLLFMSFIVNKIVQC